MSVGVELLLADAVRRDPAERRRSRLMSAGVAGAGAFLLAAVAVLTIPFSEERQPLDPRLPALAPFLAQSGLRFGVAFTAALLGLPFAAFVAQALRVGTAARERRLAALRLAGATRADLRRIAAVEGARAGLIGSLLVAPAYLVLWLLLGLGLPRGARMLPPLLAGQVWAWAALVPLLTVVAAAASALSVRAAVDDPVGGSRHRTRALSVVRLWLPVGLPVALPVLAIGGLLAGPVVFGPGFWSAAVWGLVAVPILIALGAGPGLMVISGRLAARSRDLAWQLAGRRLLADPRTPGRASGVLLAAGTVIGVVSIVLASVAGDSAEWDDAGGMALGGFLAVLLAAGFAMLVATLSQLVGATEQVLDQRRSTAVLSALGAPPGLIEKAVRRQLMAASVVPAVVGAVGGWLLWGLLSLIGFVGLRSTSLAGLLVAVLLAGGVARAGARLVARLLRGPLTEAMGVGNLRAP